MLDEKFGSQCKLICLGLGAVAGVIALYAAFGKVGFFAALLLGVAMGVFMALVLQQLFCTGEDADIGQMEATDQSASTGAASAAASASGPPKANAPKDRGTPVPTPPAPNPPKPNPPVGTAPEPRLPNHADPLNARAGTGATAAAAAGADKIVSGDAHKSGGNAAASAVDPTFTSGATDAEAGAKVGGEGSGTGAAKKTKAKANTKPKAKAKDDTPDYDKDGVKEGDNEGTKPAGLDGPRGGTADNLKEIKGVGPKLENLLHSMGFYHFDQIANWSSDEVAWVDANLKGFKGRVSRDNWIDQAKTLAAGGDTEFSKRVEEGDVY